MNTEENKPVADAEVTSEVNAVVPEGSAEQAVVAETPTSPVESPYVEPVVDLEKERDDKCIPLAREILADLVEGLIPEDPSVGLKPVTLKMLEKCLDNDLNVMTEVTYLPQLVLGVLSGLNRTMQLCDTVPLDDVRYDGIARKLLALISAANVRMTNLTPEEIDKDFAEVKVQINALFAEEKLSVFEAVYVRDKIFNSFKELDRIFSGLIQDATARAEAKMFGVDSMNELTTKKLDEVLKS